jgi:hypothetical protein
MASSQDTPHSKVTLVETGRHGARLRDAGRDAESTDGEQAAPRRRRGSARAAAVEELDAPHPMLRFSSDDLKAELARRQRQVEYLKLQHGALLRQVAEIEAQIGRLTPSGSLPRTTQRARGPRAAPAENALSLADALAQAVAVGDSISPAQAAERVLATGYKSNAQRFGVLVATALAKDGRFERTGRGQYLRKS